MACTGFRKDAEVNGPKLIATLAVWFAYLVVLYLRLTRRLYAKRLAVTCVALFLAAILSIWPIDSSRGDKESITPDSELSPAE